MAGNILLKEFSSTGTSLYSSGGTVTNGSSFSIGTFDLRSGGATDAVESIAGFFQLKWKATTVTGFVQGTTLASAYIIPALDGTNYVTIDSTSGAAYISTNHYVGSFSNALASPSTSTDYRSATPIFDAFPTLYTVYIINVSGQTLTIDDFSYYMAEGQYT